LADYKRVSQEWCWIQGDGLEPDEFDAIAADYVILKTVGDMVMALCWLEVENTKTPPGHSPVAPKTRYTPVRSDTRELNSVQLKHFVDAGGE